MSKSLCVIDESPALLPPPVLLFAGLVLLSCPVQKYTCFLFFLFIENKKLHIWSLLACVHALSLKSEISLAYCEFNTLFELARAADGNALPAKTPCGTGRKHSTKGKAAEVSRGGDTVRCVDSAKQHLQSQTRKINCGAAVPLMTSWSTARALKDACGVCARCRTVLTADLRQPPPTPDSPLQLKCCCCWVALYPCLISDAPPAFSASVRLLTSLRAGSRTCWWCSCSGPALSSCQPPPGEGRRSLAPGRPRALRSGSPSVAGRPASASPPRCFSLAGSSISHPVGGGGVVCWGVWGGRWREERRRKKNKKTKEEERVGWEGSVIWWGCQKWEKGMKGGNSWIVTGTK